MVRNGVMVNVVEDFVIFFWLIFRREWKRKENKCIIDRGEF